jgi:hypothetical protein
MLLLIGIFLLVLGLLNIFAKDIMWGITEWGNQTRGIESDRTETWDTMSTIQGVVAIIISLISLYAFIKGG